MKFDLYMVRDKRTGKFTSYKKGNKPKVYKRKSDAGLAIRLLAEPIANALAAKAGCYRRQEFPHYKTVDGKRVVDDTKPPQAIYYTMYEDSFMPLAKMNFEAVPYELVEKDA